MAGGCDVRRTPRLPLEIGQRADTNRDRVVRLAGSGGVLSVLGLFRDGWGDRPRLADDIGDLPDSSLATQRVGVPHSELRFVAVDQTASHAPQLGYRSAVDYEARAA